MSSRETLAPSGELELLDQVFSSLLNLARSSVGTQEMPTLVGLMALNLVSDAERAPGPLPWNTLVDVASTPAIVYSLRSLSVWVEQHHRGLEGVFTSGLLAGIDSAPKNALQRWCREVSRLSTRAVADVSFARWIAFHLSTYSRDFFHRDRLSTPQGLARLMASLADIKDGNSVLDPSCGAGTLLAAALEDARENRIKVDLYGQELMPVRWALCRLCIFFFSSTAWNVVLGDALRNPAFAETDGWETFDRVLSDPPMGMRQREPEIDRFLGMHWSSLGPLTSRASETLFVQHAVARLKPRGKAVLLLPQGFLFRSGIEARIREKLVTEKRLEAVIALPAKRIPSSAVEIALLVLGPNDSGRVRFLDAAARDNPKYGKSDLPPEMAEWIIATFRSQNEDLGEDARSVSSDELAAAEFTLLPRRYLPAKYEAPERLDVDAARAKLRQLETTAFEACGEMDEILDDLG